MDLNWAHWTEQKPCVWMASCCRVWRRRAGWTWQPRRSSLCITTLSWRARAGWGTVAVQRTPGTVAARCCWMDSSPPRKHLHFVPSVCIVCAALLYYKAISPPLAPQTHKCLCISQDLLPQCAPAIKDSGDLHLQEICWDHCFHDAEDNIWQSLHIHKRPGFKL